MGSRPLATSAIDRGRIVLVPFPFTDLSGSKRRPALVLSPPDFDAEDVILCAITSRLEAARGAWAIQLDAVDVLDARLPRPSVILVGKLFTIHRGLVAAQFGRVTPAKFAEAIDYLVRLLSARSPRK